MNLQAHAQSDVQLDPATASTDGSDAGVAWLGEHFETGEVADSEPVEAHAPDVLPDRSGEPANVEESWSEQPAESPHRRIVGGFLVALGVAWIGTVAWAAGQAVGGSANGAPDLVRWAAVASGPLALLGLGWLLFGRSSRGEAVRFTRAVTAMRAESEALQAVLANVGANIAANRAALAEETQRLAHLGEEAAERLGAVTRDVDAGAQAMARYAETLDRSAGSARTDMGVLLADLPKADAQARAMSELLRATGLDAHQQAGALEAQMTLLAVRAREADEASTHAAGRMAAHLAQVDSAATAATGRMESATAAMSAGIDGVLTQAADALGAVRTGIDEQGAATMATIGQSGAAMERIASDADAALATRMDAVRASVAEGGEAMRALVAETAGQIEAASAAAARELDARLDAARAGIAEQSDAVDALVARTGEGTAQAAAATEAALRAATEQSRAALEQQAELALSLTRDALDALERTSLDAGGNLTKRADVARQMLLEMGAEMVASVHRSNVELEAAAGEAATTLARHVGEISGRVGAIGAQIAAQDAASQAMIGGVDRSLADMETRFGTLSERGGARLTALATAAETLVGTVDALVGTIDGGDARIGGMTERTQALRVVLDAVGEHLSGPLATILADVEASTMRSRDIAAALAPEVAAFADSAGLAQARLAEAETLVGRQQSGLDEMLGAIGSGLDTIQTRVDALGSVVADTDERAAKLLRDTGPQLIEALLRVRETANQAAERAREAISAAIPDAAARLADATGAAMTAAITEQVTLQMGELGILSEQAVEAARAASERLTRQMLTIGETVATAEARIAEAQETLREGDSEQFSRRVALLIESLNSTAIDVTKILSNEVTDGAWAAYLKGDRGVFTRRAVRLLEAGEAREIARHYEEEPEFREQVNRYIHDFEALLRRILSERDGSPLGLTMLSSDMGKLYVALAQAIERIRG